MSDMARKARLALKAKAKSLANEKDTKVDSSDWTQAEPLNADVKTGARPVSRRAFKKGGKVTGEKAKANMGKKQRAMGGSTPRDYANAKVNRNVKDANEEREGKKHVGGFKKGGRARHGYATDGEVESYDREGLKGLIERESTGPSRPGNPEQLMPKGKGVKTREVEAFDLYDPEQLKRLERGYKKGGRAKKKIGGALEFLSPVAMLANAVRGDDDDKGKKHGGRAKKNDGGGAGMRSENTVAAKAQRDVMDKSDDFNQFESKYGNAFRMGDSRATEYADKAAKYGAAKKAYDRALEERGPLKKGGRAKKMMGGPMMGDPRLGMVSGDALPGYSQLTPGKKKGGKVHSDEAMDKALIKKMVKPSARTGRKDGGKIDAEKEIDKSAAQSRWESSKHETPLSQAAMRGAAANLQKRSNPKAAEALIDATASVGRSLANRANADKDALMAEGKKRGGRTKRASGGRQSFNSAFAEARKNGMDLFEWNGKLYNTQLAPAQPARPPMPPRRPEAGIGAGERPEQSGRELDAIRNMPAPRTTTMPQVDQMGTPTGMTQEVPVAEGPSLRERLGDMIGIRGRNTPMFARGSGDQVYAGPRDGSGEARKHGGRTHYADGGMTMDNDGPKKAKKGSGKTNINIVIAGGKPAAQQDMMAPPPGGPVVPQPPRKGPPAPPPAAPGMPMGIPVGVPMGAPPQMPPQQPPMPPMGRKAGGRVTKVASSYKDMEAGAASGEGRLQKTDIAKKTMKQKFEKGENVYEGRGYPNKVLGATGGRTARKAGGGVYRSYKDMDAGAGSGEGRLEKTEIQKRKR